MAITKTAMVVSAAVLSVPLIGDLPAHLPLVAFSGLMGGFCRWFALREKGWPDGVGSVVLGTIAAVFLWPLAEPIFGPLIGKIALEPSTSHMLGGFLTGLSGISLIGLFLDFIRARRRQQENNDAAS